MKRITITLLTLAIALVAVAPPASAIETLEMSSARDAYQTARAEAAQAETLAALLEINGPYDNARDEFPWKVERWRPVVALYFPEDRIEWALRIIQCESRGDPNAKNRHSSASGLFQHLARLWPERAARAGFAGTDVFDPYANIAVAAWLLEHGGTSNWVCKARK
jgi:hypothetical protein